MKQLDKHMMNSLIYDYTIIHVVLFNKLISLYTFRNHSLNVAVLMTSRQPLTRMSSPIPRGGRVVAWTTYRTAAAVAQQRTTIKPELKRHVHNLLLDIEIR